MYDIIKSCRIDKDRNTQLKPKTILTSTIFVASATLLVRFFSFLREITLASSYGAGMVSDAFIVAFTVPGSVLALVGASTAAVFIPAYTRVEGDKEYFTSNVLTILALIGLLFTAVFATFPQALVFVFASQLDAQTFELTAQMLRIMVWSAIPILLFGVLQSYLQIKNAFFTAAILVIPVNIYTILSIMLSRAAETTFIMGYGVVAGNIMALFLLFVAVFRKGFKYKPVIDFKMPELKMLLVMLAPVMVSTFINEINLIADRNFASSLPVGTISSLNYAGKTINILIGTIGASVATVLYPRMSKYAAQDNIAEIRRCVTGSVNKLIPILLPAVVGIIILARPIVRIVFERGEFTDQNTKMAMEGLQMYAPLLVFSCINVIFIRALFSVRDTKTPAIITAISVAIGIALKFLFIGPLAHKGLALSSSISAMLSLVLLFFALRRRIGLLSFKKNISEWVKIQLALIIMAAAVAAGYHLLPVMDGSTIQCILLTGGLVFSGATIYVLVLAVTRAAFISETIALVRGLFTSRLNGKEEI